MKTSSLLAASMMMAAQMPHLYQHVYIDKSDAKTPERLVKAEAKRLRKLERNSRGDT
jgi:hypothetical protein